MENSQLSLCLTSRERLRFGQYHGANRNHWIVKTLVSSALLGLWYFCKNFRGQLFSPLWFDLITSWFIKLTTSWERLSAQKAACLCMAEEGQTIDANHSINIFQISYCLDLYIISVQNNDHQLETKTMIRRTANKAAAFRLCSTWKTSCSSLPELYELIFKE